MGKTVIGSYGFLSEGTKCKATVVGSLDVGNTPQNTEAVFTSSTNDDQLKHNERLHAKKVQNAPGGACVPGETQAILQTKWLKCCFLSSLHPIQEHDSNKL